MKKFIFLFFFTALLFAEKIPQCPHLTIFSDVSDSGIKTYLVQIPRAQVASIKICFRGGVFAENEKHGSGLAYAVQTLLFSDIKNEFNKINNYYVKLNAKTSYDSITFSATTLKENLPDVIDKLSKIICNEKFPQKKWSKIQDFLTDKIIFEKSASWTQLNDLLRKTIFVSEPLKFPIKGNLSLFNNLNRENLLHYYNNYFTRENLIVVVAGDVNYKKIFRLIKKQFANLPETTGCLSENFTPRGQLTAKWLEQQADVTQSYVAVGFSTIPFGDKDIATLTLLSKIIDKDELKKVLKANTKKLNDIKIQLLNFPCANEEFVISFSCDKGSATRAARAAENYILNLSNKKWDEKKIRREKTKIFTDYLSSLNSPEQICNQISSSVIQLGNPHYPEMRMRQILEVNPETVKNICKKYFVSQHLATAILSPENDEDEVFGLPKNNILRDERALLGNHNIPVKNVILRNGATLLLRHIPDAPTVNVVFSAIGGLWCENENVNGVFAIIAKLMQAQKIKNEQKSFLNKFRKNRKNVEIFPQANVSFQNFTLSATVPRDEAEQAVKQLCRDWSSLDINEKNISFAINSLISNYDTTNENALADAAFRASFFYFLPYRLNLNGSKLSYPLLNSKVVSDFYNDFITPINTTILVSGKFNEKEIINTVEKAFDKFKAKKKSDMFVASAEKYKLSSLPPILTVNLEKELHPTNQMTKIFVSQNENSIVVCGCAAPPINCSNLPPVVAKIARAAILNQLDVLKEKWIDIRKDNIIKKINVVCFQGWNTGWIYAYLVVPKKYEAEAASRLRAAIYSSLFDLSTGKSVNMASARALFENEILSEKTILKNIVFYSIFGLIDDYYTPLKFKISKCKNEDFKKFFQKYGKTTISAIITPQ